MSIEKIFKNLEIWRYGGDLPSCQLERRLDISLSPHWGLIQARLLSMEEFRDALIIPGFPLSLGNRGGASPVRALSDKVDYLAIAGNQVAFVEFKTDQTSISGYQLEYLLKATSTPIEPSCPPLKGNCTRQKAAHKYAFFLELLAKDGVISG